VSAPSLREFHRLGVLQGDHGGALEATPLVEALIGAFEGAGHAVVLVCPRRCGKSSAAALAAAHLLLTAPGSYTLWVASSEEQAADVVAQKLTRPLKRRGLALSYARDRITHAQLGSEVRVVPMAEASVPGRTVDLLILDEARAIDETCYEVLRPSAVNGRVLILGSPGRPGSWFHRAAVEPELGDVVIHLTEVRNPAVSPEVVEAERRRLERRGGLGAAIARREWSAEWVTLAEHRLLRPDDVRACSVKAEEIEQFDPDQDAVVVGVDLSLVRDLTSIAVVARRGEGYRLIEAVVMDPKDFGGLGIPLELVERRLELISRRYRPRRVLMDAFQGVSIMQRLRARGIPIAAEQVTAPLNQRLFENLAELVSERQVRWAENRRLQDELLNLEIQEGTTAWKVVDGDRRLHRDLAFSLGLALLEAVKIGNFHSEPKYEAPQKAQPVLWIPEPERPEMIAARELARAERGYQEAMERAVCRPGTTT
jgi:hypothetical protein